MEDMEISAGAVDIPEDIIPEILVRLPVKSLLRFRCVSKTWLYLISSYEFAKEQLRVSTNNNAYLHDRLLFGSTNLPMDLYTCSLQSLVQGSNSAGTQIYPPTDDSYLLNNFDRPRVDNNSFGRQGGAISFVGSCNGLVCLFSYPVETYVLWNPTTGKLKKIPNLPENISAHYKFAFGYDEVHDDYKVVESCHATDENSRLVSGGLVTKMYSPRTNSWKALSNFPVGGGHFSGGPGKFLNGAIHWIVREYSDDIFWAMVSLHLATDTFTVSRLPNIGGDHALYDVSVGILGGQLALYLKCSSQMDIWVMKEYGVHKSWTRQIRLGSGFIEPVPLVYWAEYGKILIAYPTSLEIHDLNSPRPQYPFSKEILVGCTTYIESLVSPHLDDEYLVLGRAMPSEIITEILLRLPVKSPLRFKSVSKEWRSLISSSRFVEAHLKSSTTNNNDVALIFGPIAFVETLVPVPLEGEDEQHKIMPLSAAS